MTHTTDAGVMAALAARGVTRLVHITPARNVPSILRDGAIRSVADMEEDVRAAYSANDLRRLDGHRDKVSCSLQYANAFYLGKVKDRGAAANFPDWVCFFLLPQVAATPGALFCPRNAGAFGASKTPGADGLHACYAPQVLGAGGRRYKRGPQHDSRCPTDVQAEVLVPAPIPLSLAYAIVFPSHQAAATEHARLEQLSAPLPPHLQWVVAPGLFSTVAVTAAVQQGRTMMEANWNAATDGTS